MQSKTASAVEAVLGTLLGYLIAIYVQTLVFPFFGIVIPMGTNMILAAIFTGISIVRGYGTRRFFNWLHTKGILV